MFTSGHTVSAWGLCGTNMVLYDRKPLSHSYFPTVLLWVQKHQIMLLDNECRNKSGPSWTLFPRTVTQNIKANTQRQSRRGQPRQNKTKGANILTWFGSPSLWSRPGVAGSRILCADASVRRGFCDAGLPVTQNWTTPWWTIHARMSRSASRWTLWVVVLQTRSSSSVCHRTQHAKTTSYTKHILGETFDQTCRSYWRYRYLACLTILTT